MSDPVQAFNFERQLERAWDLILEQDALLYEASELLKEANAGTALRARIETFAARVKARERR